MAIGDEIPSDAQRIEKLESLVRHLIEQVDGLESDLGKAEARIADLEDADYHGQIKDVEGSVENVENQIAQLQADFDDSQLGE